MQLFKAVFAKNHWLCNINLIEVNANFSSTGTKSRTVLAEEPLAMFSKNSISKTFMFAKDILLFVF
ncbi:hypothetical protein AQF98_14375 [Pedobacter sp. Hv1]|nr:hypothetical protein AQF98_14375 [Pedobacter sp. Hv1]